jgi:hypothetical protein
MSSAQNKGGPDYASPETKEVIEMMIEAHGGMDIWRTAPTLSYVHEMVDPNKPDDSWLSHEVIEQGRRRLYQDWPLDGAVLVYDGDETWTVDWSKPNQPKMMALFFFYFVNLPWVTQDDNVQLGKPERSSLPGLDKEFYSILMSFRGKPAPGKTAEDSFRLFIDPDTYRLRGYEYVMGYGAMLDGMGVPPGQLFGPMLRIHQAFVEVDGLVFPAEMRTMPPDGSVIYGHHVISNHSLHKKWDESRMRKPGKAVIDMSSDQRAPAE